MKSTLTEIDALNQRYANGVGTTFLRLSLTLSDRAHFHVDVGIQKKAVSISCECFFGGDAVYHHHFEGVGSEGAFVYFGGLLL